MTFQTLSAVVSEVENYVSQNDIVLTDPEGFYDSLWACQNYGEVKRLTGPRSGEIFAKRGKATKSRLVVVIERFGLNDGRRMGCYELTCCYAS